MKNKNPDITYTNDRSVSCKGEGAMTGHPLVYFNIDPQSEEMVCPYCSKIFKLKKNKGE